LKGSRLGLVTWGWIPLTVARSPPSCGLQIPRPLQGWLPESSRSGGTSAATDGALWLFALSCIHFGCLRLCSSALIVFCWLSPTAVLPILSPRRLLSRLTYFASPLCLVLLGLTPSRSALLEAPRDLPAPTLLSTRHRRRRVPWVQGRAHSPAYYPPV
jgi:hypothetical protein